MSMSWHCAAPVHSSSILQNSAWRQSLIQVRMSCLQGPSITITCGRYQFDLYDHVIAATHLERLSEAPEV